MFFTYLGIKAQKIHTKPDIKKNETTLQETYILCAFVHVKQQNGKKKVWKISYMGIENFTKNMSLECFQLLTYQNAKAKENTLIGEIE